MLGYDQLCPACTEEQQGQHDHTYKPIRQYFSCAEDEGRVSESAFHMGFEIEVANVGAFMDHQVMSHVIREKYGSTRVYCVHDGTINQSTGYDGTEIVTHPFTWQDYKAKLKTWDDLLLFLRSKGYKANLCGIGFHVHTTKAAWGSFQIYKLMEFVYENPKFIQDIAQREENEYCQFDPRNLDPKVAKLKKNTQPNHYGTVNLNNGNGQASNTIEFRMFQGSLEPLYFHKNIEFVRAIYKYTRDYRDMTPKGFIMFVTKNRREYPCLNEFLKGI
jgi:hypothetical protein